MLIQLFHDEPFFIRKFLRDGLYIKSFYIPGTRGLYLLQPRIFKEYYQQQVIPGNGADGRQLPFQAGEGLEIREQHNKASLGDTGTDQRMQLFIVC